MESELETREMLWNTVLLRFDYFWKTKTKRRGKKKQKTHCFTFLKFRAKFKTEKNSAAIFPNEKSFGGKKFRCCFEFWIFKKTICILKNFWDELVAADVAVNLTNFRIERFSETEPGNKVRVEKRAMMRPGNVRRFTTGSSTTRSWSPTWRWRRERRGRAWWCPCPWSSSNCERNKS